MYFFSFLVKMREQREEQEIALRKREAAILFAPFVLILVALSPTHLFVAFVKILSLSEIANW